MSIQDALDDLASLNDRGDGDLIKSLEWNTLVNGVISIGTALQTLTSRVTAIESYVGYDEAYDGDNLKLRIEQLEGYVGSAGDTGEDATLSGRVAALEAVDNVTQAEHDALESTIQPLLEQYVVSFSTDETDYLLGDTAAITATVRTLNGEIPEGRPWVDFIATWGRLKPEPGAEAKEGTGNRSLSVRTNSQGVARVQVTAEQNRHLSLEEEEEVSKFFTMELPTEPILFGEAVKNAPTTQSEYMEMVFTTVSHEYESNRLAVKRLIDEYYVETAVGGRWGGRRPQTRWEKYRTTVVGFVKNDSNPTTPDHSRGISSIQILFQDWIRPWVDVYVEDDGDEVAGWQMKIEDWFRVDPDGVIENLDIQVKETIFERGIVGRHKGLSAVAKAALQVDGSVIPDKGEWVRDVIRHAAETQRATDILQFTTGPAEMGGAGAPAMKAMFAQGKHVNDVSQQAAQAKDEVLGSSEFADLQGAVSILQNSTATVGKDIMGALSDIEHKVVNINAFDSESLQTSVSQIKAHIGIVRKNVPDV